VLAGLGVVLAVKDVPHGLQTAYLGLVSSAAKDELLSCLISHEGKNTNQKL
jgi:hypothetical protein